MDKEWKDLEIIVQMICSSIEPGSRIRHNVNLPVINSSSKRTRQCDILIESGPTHRRTLTIVEVQSRKKQVDINTFNGWIEKLKEVGAQHLICVSRKDFPESIREKVIECGNTCKLVVIKEILPEEIPNDFARFSFLYQDIKIIPRTKIEVGFSKSKAIEQRIYNELRNFIDENREMELNSPSFSLDQIEAISLYQLCKEAITDRTEKSGVGRIEFKYDDDKPLYLSFSSQFTSISLSLDFDWKIEEYHYPVTQLVYEQEGSGPLAWIIDFKAKTPGGSIELKLPLVKRDSGYAIAGFSTRMDKAHEIALIQG